MTNHSYFNLAGHDYEDGVMDHVISINADAFTPSNERSVPTKEVKPVDEVPSMDLRKPKNLKEATKALGLAQGYTQEEVEQAINREGRGGPPSEGLAAQPLGFDYNWVCNDYQGPQHIRSVAKVYHPLSGRYMEVLTTTPGV
jgi:aldose 1-epimerase